MRLKLAHSWSCGPQVTLHLRGEVARKEPRPGFRSRAEGNEGRNAKQYAIRAGVATAGRHTACRWFDAYSANIEMAM